MEVTLQFGDIAFSKSAFLKALVFLNLAFIKRKFQIFFYIKISSVTWSLFRTVIKINL